MTSCTYRAKQVEEYNSKKIRFSPTLIFIPAPLLAYVLYGDSDRRRANEEHAYMYSQEKTYDRVLIKPSKFIVIQRHTLTISTVYYL